MKRNYKYETLPQSDHDETLNNNNKSNSNSMYHLPSLQQQSINNFKYFSMIFILNDSNRMCRLSDEMIISEYNCNGNKDVLKIGIIITPPSAINCNIPNLSNPITEQKDSKIIIDSMIKRLKNHLKIIYHQEEDFEDEKVEYSIEKTKLGFIDYLFGFDSDKPHIIDSKISMMNGSYIITLSIQNIIRTIVLNNKTIIGFSLNQKPVKHLEIFTYYKQGSYRDSVIYQVAILYSNLFTTVLKPNLENNIGFNKAKLFNIYLINITEKLDNIIKLEFEELQKIYYLIIDNFKRSIESNCFSRESDIVPLISSMKIINIHPMVMIVAISSMCNSLILYEYMFLNDGDGNGRRNYYRAMLLYYLSDAMFIMLKESGNEMLLKIMEIFSSCNEMIIKKKLTSNLISSENDNIENLYHEMMNYSMKDATNEDRFSYMMNNYSNYLSYLSLQFKISPKEYSISEETLYTDINMIMDLIGFKSSTNNQKIISYYLDNISLGSKMWNFNQLNIVLTNDILNMFMEYSNNDISNESEKEIKLYESTIEFLRSLSKTSNNSGSQFLKRLNRTLIKIQSMRKLEKLDDLYFNKTIRYTNDLIKNWKKSKNEIYNSILVNIEYNNINWSCLFLMYNYMLLSNCIDHCEYLILIAENIEIFKNINHDVVIGFICVLKYLLNFIIVLMNDMKIETRECNDIILQNRLINTLLTVGIEKRWCEQLTNELGEIASITKADINLLSKICFLLKLNVNLDEVIDSHKEQYNEQYPHKEEQLPMFQSYNLIKSQFTRQLPNPIITIQLKELLDKFLSTQTIQKENNITELDEFQETTQQYIKHRNPKTMNEE